VLNLFAVTLVYAGFAATAAGLISSVRPLRFCGIRTRKHALAVCGAGAGIAAAGMIVPAPPQRVETVASALDRAMPSWQFHEVHTIRIAAPPDAVYRSIHSVTADEILFFRTLTWIRSPHFGRSDGRSILQPPSDPVPLLTVALRSGFITISDEPAREIVIGTVVAGHISALRGARTAENFVRLSAPGFVKATMNFLIEPAGPRTSDVTTETRVFATDARTSRLFAPYWRVIYPGSALIRRMWLRAVKRRAESA
jgi:hypothetical protein